MIRSLFILTIAIVAFYSQFKSPIVEADSNDVASQNRCVSFDSSFTCIKAIADVRKSPSHIDINPYSAFVGDFTVSATPTSRTVTQGGTASYTITILSTGGFNSPVSLTALNLPGNQVLPGTGFTPSTVTPPTNGSISSTLTIVTNNQTPIGNFTITVRGTNGATIRNTSITLTVNPTGDFSISRSPTSRTVSQGGTATYTVTVQSLSSFSGPVALTALNLPGNQVLLGTGYSPQTVTPSANGTVSSTLSIVTNSQTPTGTFTVTVRGICGNITRDTTVSITVNGPPDFTIAASPASRTVTQGSTTNYTVTVQSINGFNSAVSLTALNLPGNQVLPGTGFSPQSITPPSNSSTTSTFAIVTNNQTPTGTFTITVRGTSGSIVKNTTVSITIDQAGDFSITPSPTSRTIAQGATTTYSVGLQGSGGFGGTIALTALNLPGNQVLPGTGFSPASVTLATNGSGTSTLTIVTNNQTPTGTFTITIRGTSGSIVRDATVSITVTAPGDFSVSAIPASRSITRGSTTTFTVTIQSLNGFNSAVNLIALNLPGNQVLPGTGFSPTPVTPSPNGSTTSTLTIVTNNQTPTGTFTITIRGTSGSLIRETTVSLTVNQLGDFSVSASPGSRTVTHGGTATYTITVQSTGGFSSPVSLTALNLPGNQVLPGTGFSPQSLTPTANGSSASTLNIVTNNQTLAGSFNITVRGTSGSTIRETTINLTVSQGGNFTISASPSSRTISRGNTATYVVSLTNLGSSGNIVSLFAINLPNNQVLGGTGFDPAQVSLGPNGTGSSTLSITTNNQTQTGTFVITVRGVSGGITRETQVTLVINASYSAPVITQPISPSTVNYNQPTPLTVVGNNFRAGLSVGIITPDCPAANPCWIAQSGIHVDSGSQVRVDVKMLGAPPYPATLKIINDDGQFATGAFQVAGTGAPAPTISNITSTPSPVPIGTPTWLTVTGDNFVNKPEIRISWPNCGGSCPATIAPEAVQFVSSSQVRVQVNMGGTPSYQATLYLKNPDGQNAPPRQFSVGGSTATLELFGLEVTQGIQNLANDVELICIKPTWVRAHVRLVQSLTGEVVAGARLVGTRLDGTPLPGSPLSPVNSSQGLNTGSIRVKASPERISRNDSYLFSLPAEWTIGTVDLKFEGVSHNFINNEPDGSHDGIVRKTFNDTPNLTINLVKVSWGATEPTAQEMARVAADLRIMLPSKIINFKYSQLSAPSQPSYSFPFFESLTTELYNKRRTECGSCPDLYLAIISPRSVPEPPNSGTWGYAPTINDTNCSPDRRGIVASTFFFPVDHRLRFTHIHEFGHLLGRFHTPYPGTNPNPLGTCDHPFNGTIGGNSPSPYSTYVVWGFNGQYGFPSLTPDVMSYADYGYVSRFTYEGMLGRIRSLASSARTQGESSLLASQGDEVLLISGTVQRDQPVGRLSAIYKLPSPSSVPANGQGDVRIAFYDSGNNELASYPFEPEFGSEGDVGLFGLLLPQQPSATRMSLLRAGQVLDSRQASANQPTVTINSPNGGEILNGNSSTIEWAGLDADGDSLTYLIQVSGNNGATWTTLASNLTDNNYVMDLTSLAGTNQGRIRVLASDGFHTAQDESNAVFTIVGRGPTVNMVTPTNNAGYVGNQPIVFQGNAVDLEDGDLSGTALKWTSNLDGQIGTGTSLTRSALDLTEGVHTISLSAQDSEGYITSSPITVRIFRSRPVLPTSLSLAPSDLSFVAQVGAGLTASQILAVRNDGDGDLAWTATANQPWIQISSISGAAPSNPEVRINPTGLALGSYSGTITLTTPDATNSPLSVNVSLTIVSYPVAVLNTPFDFDGDSKTDLSIFRPNAANGAEWWWSRSSNGGNGAVQFGAAPDTIAAADYTGDGKTDVAFWRPSTGQWFVLRSEDFSFYAFPFGATGDVPVPGDFDGDGKADAAVFRPSNVTWYISKSTGGTDIVTFGATGDKPVAADYDGDGKADVAIFRPNGANGAEWWIRRSSNSTVFATQFGSPTDKAVPGDYTGDGKSDIAFWTPSSGNWFVLRSEDYSYFGFPFGSATDIPTPGDFDGDGKMDAAVFRPSNSTWYANRSTAGVLIQQFGTTGDVPVPNAYVR